MNDEDRARRRKEDRKRLLRRLNSYGEGAPYNTEESERELERLREIERNRRPEPGTAAGFAGGA